MLVTLGDSIGFVRTYIYMYIYICTHVHTHVCQDLYGAKLHPVEVELTVYGESFELEKKKVLVILLFDVWREMHKLCPGQFKDSFFGGLDSEGVKSYWDHLSRGVDHHVNTPAWSAKRAFTAPLLIHADDVEIHRNVSYTVFSASSAVVSDIHSFDQQFLTCSLEQEWVCNQTYDEIAEIYKYMEDAFDIGRIPHVKPLSKEPWEEKSYWASQAGSPIVSNAEGGPAHWAAFVGTQGDLKEKVKQCKYERNYLSNFMCELCLGCRHREVCSGYNFKHGADWLCTLTSHQTYLLTHTLLQRAPWCKLKSWTIHRWLWDLLHLLWLLLF